MSQSGRVVVVGAGPGGLCAAMLLASRGLEVTVLEKRDHVGGRTSGFRIEEYSFDLGSTLLMMRFLVEEMFDLADSRMSDEMEVVRLDPMYRLVFGGRSLDMYADPERMEVELERFSPGSRPALLRFLEREHTRLEHLFPLLQRTWPTVASFLDPAVVLALPHVGLGESLHDTARSYFEDERVQLGFSFQSAYLGMSPWDCPGGFGMVPYVEHAWGVDYVIGGLHQLCLAMARIGERRGARIRTGAEVRRILVQEGRTAGVELADGERVAAGTVVIDADAVAALTHLVDQDVSLRFSRERLDHMRESCSTFMLYLGLDTPLPLGHHTFLFAEDYRAEMERVFRAGTLDEDLSVYACNPIVTDSSVAPPGHSALYLLALVPNARAGIDWEVEAGPMRARILAALRRRIGVDLEPHIRVERCVTPTEWERSYHISHGAVFGPAHNIGQLLAFRLPHELPSPEGVFLTGGGTSPGSGLATILESARISSRLVCERRGIPFPAPRPLPEPSTWRRSGRGRGDRS